MIKILKTIVTKLGGLDVSESNHIDTYTENRIITAKGKQIASSETGGIWLESQELAGFTFLNATIIGQHNLKTYDGCELIFSGNGVEQKLISDTKELESDFSNVSNRWITLIAFDVTGLNVGFIENKAVDTVQLNCNKVQEIFNIIK